MEKFFNPFILILLIFTGCADDPAPLPDIDSGLTEEELQLSRTWQYNFINADTEEEFVYATSQMEPSKNRNTAGGNRSDLFRRRIRYFTDGTYQLQWSERGDYSLGTEGDPNWQPSYGYWELNGNQLIHNKGLPYETTYTVNVTQDEFIRTHNRYMSVPFSNNGQVIWSRGEYVTYIEYLILID